MLAVELLLLLLQLLSLLLPELLLVLKMLLLLLLLLLLQLLSLLLLELLLVLKMLLLLLLLLLQLLLQLQVQHARASQLQGLRELVVLLGNPGVEVERARPLEWPARRRLGSRQWRRRRRRLPMARLL